MTHASHFYNAMPVVYKEHEFKVPGTVESVYALQDMTVEVIADGIHVPPVMLKIVYKIKGVEKTALITDSLAYAASEGDVSAEARVIMEAFASWPTARCLPALSPQWTFSSAPAYRRLRYR